MQDDFVTHTNVKRYVKLKLLILGEKKTYKTCFCHFCVHRTGLLDTHTHAHLAAICCSFFLVVKTKEKSRIS